MNAFDPFEQLVELAKHQRADITTPEHLRTQLTGDTTSTTRRRRQRRTRTLAVIAAITLFSGTAVAAAWWWGQPDRPEAGPVCRLAADLDADQYALTPEQDPVPACQQLWESGLFPNPDEPLPAPQPAPPLTACISSNGIVEVFPADADICTSLGLEPANPTPAPDRATIAALSNEVSATINDPTQCLTVTEAVDAAQQLLDTNQLHSWTVTTNPALDVPACAKAAVDTETSRLVVFEFATN